MNMPQTEFLCGIPQKDSLDWDWRKHYRHQIFVFERHREQEPMRDLGFLIARWLRKKRGLPSDVGYVHQVQFPEQPAMELLAWTAYRAFQLEEPNDSQPAPTQLLLFTHVKQLVVWKKAYWDRVHMPSTVGFTVHANCYDPDGRCMYTRRLLSFTHG